MYLKRKWYCCADDAAVESEYDDELLADAENAWAHREWSIQHILFPSMRLFFKPLTSMASNGTFVRVLNLILSRSLQRLFMFETTFFLMLFCTCLYLTFTYRSSYSLSISLSHTYMYMHRDKCMHLIFVYRWCCLLPIFFRLLHLRNFTRSSKGVDKQLSLLCGSDIHGSFVTEVWDFVGGFK